MCIMILEFFHFKAWCRLQFPAHDNLPLLRHNQIIQQQQSHTTSKLYTLHTVVICLTWHSLLRAVSYFDDDTCMMCIIHITLGHI